MDASNKLFGSLKGRTKLTNLLRHRFDRFEVDPGLILIFGQPRQHLPHPLYVLLEFAPQLFLGGL